MGDMGEQGRLKLAINRRFRMKSATPEGSPAKVFACSIGDKKVFVTTADGRLVYRYGNSQQG